MAFFVVPGVCVFGSLAGRYRGSDFELQAAGDIKQRIATLVEVLDPGRGRGLGPVLAGGVRDGDQGGKNGYLDLAGAVDQAVSPGLECQSGATGRCGADSGAVVGGCWGADAAFVRCGAVLIGVRCMDWII